jgi:DNA-binding NtrC family response regulator
MEPSKALRELIRKTEKISKTNLDTLILGESGIGKDWIASEIIQNSDLEKIDSSDWKTSLNLLTAQSILKKENLIFFNLEDLDTEGQLLLSRAIEKKEIIYNKINIQFKRIFFLANASLLEKVKSGNFREDLFSKISSVQLMIPPLRERKEDILYFTDLFLIELCKKHRKTVPELSENFINFLLSNPWFGNLRELKSLLESIIIFGKGQTLTVKHIPSNYKNSITNRSELSIKPGISLKIYEKEIIKTNLIQSNGNRKKTSEILGISERNLYRKIKDYNLDNLSFGSSDDTLNDII